MLRVVPVLLIAGALLPATTLEQLSMQDMINKSTAIVRGKVLSSRTSQQRSIIYTHYTVQVAERWKGQAEQSMEVVIPGGQFGNSTQRFAGTPALAAGSEYVLILWKGRNGLNQVIGLSQGVFNMQRDSAGDWILNRSAGDAAMLDPRTGREVEDQPVRMTLKAFDQQVRKTLAKE